MPYQPLTIVLDDNYQPETGAVTRGCDQCYKAFIASEYWPIQNLCPDCAVNVLARLLLIVDNAEDEDPEALTESANELPDAPDPFQKIPDVIVRPRRKPSTAQIPKLTEGPSK